MRERERERGGGEKWGGGSLAGRERDVLFCQEHFTILYLVSIRATILKSKKKKFTMS